MSRKNKKDFMLRGYSYLNYFFVGSLIFWLLIRLLILLSPDGDRTGFFVGNEPIYLFNNIPLSWLHGFYLYELNIGALRFIVITALSIVVVQALLKRQNKEFSLSTKQNYIFRVAVLVIILAILSLIGSIVYYILVIRSMKDWQF